MNERLTAIENRLYVLEHDLSVAFAIINRISAALDGNYEEFYDEATYRGLVDVHLPPYPDPGVAPEAKELITCPEESPSTTRP